MLLETGLKTPMPTPTINPELVTPGFAGFAVAIVVLVAMILLVLDMNRRIRRVRYREEVREELDAEEAALNEHRATDAVADDPANGEAAEGDAGDRPEKG